MMLALWFVAAVIMAVPASAQTGGAPKWEIEIHGGGLWPTNPAAGTASLPAPGQVFTTATAAPAPSSRRESSWYFGDGTLLFNQAVASLFAQSANPATPPRITALDPVLGVPLAARKTAASFGVSVSRMLTPRFSAELRVDYSDAPVEIMQSNSDGIEAARASFATAFEGMIRFNPNRVLNSVTSTAELEDGRSRQLAVTGALSINLRTIGDIIPYATLGAGLISTSGETAAATLEGNYQFRLGAGGAPISETDSVTVKAVRDDRMFAGIVGGGMKYLVSPAWGLRLDVRVAISQHAAGTIVDAAPAVALDLRPSGRGVLNAQPSIQFSNNSSDPVTAGGVTAVAASTLTGPPITGFSTFSGSGVVSDTSLVAGIFWRF